MASLAGALCGKSVRFILAIVAAFPATCQQRDSTTSSQVNKEVGKTSPEENLIRSDRRRNKFLFSRKSRVIISL
jgi:hypothetical protein